jgi:hypothetical protein
MEGHAPSWPRWGVTVCAGPDVTEHVPPECPDATERVPPGHTWGAPLRDGGPRSVVAAIAAHRLQGRYANPGQIAPQRRSRQPPQARRAPRRGPATSAATRRTAPAARPSRRHHLHVAKPGCSSRHRRCAHNRHFSTPIRLAISHFACVRTLPAPHASYQPRQQWLSSAVAV